MATDVANTTQNAQSHKNNTASFVADVVGIQPRPRRMHSHTLIDVGCTVITASVVADVHKTIFNDVVCAC